MSNESKLFLQVQEMFDLQDKLNKVVDENWVDLNRHWYRAVWTECSELMDHLVWKWWKKPVPDMAQAKMELVDIWHFGISDIIVKMKEQNTTNLEPIVKTINNSNLVFVKTENPDLLSMVETFAAQSIQMKGFDLFTFITLLNSFDMSFDELYFQYVGKNVLNKFRQDNGYKTGEYEKIWFGKEDNVHLQEMLDKLTMVDSVINLSGILYNMLEAGYNQHLTNQIPH